MTGKKILLNVWILILTICIAGTQIQGSNGNGKYDYVIIVGDEDLVSSVQPLKTWKEQIGYSVKVVTVNSIYQNYTSGDDAEKIWNFLHDKYPPSQWGIRYVLFVGDIDFIPMRVLYPNGKEGDGGGYGSDYYYAQLSVSTWDIDGDNRWGEFDEDSLDFTPDVLVGRIPFNDSTIVNTTCTNIVSFEQDTGSWKRNALLAHGILGYSTLNPPGRSDAADLAEKVKQDILIPQGWSYTTLYEEDGISQSAHVPDHPLSQTNFENQCALKTQSLVNCSAHGEPRAMTSMVWSHDLGPNKGIWDVDPQVGPSEKSSTTFSKMDAISAYPTSSVVFLCGCSTGAIFGDDPSFNSSNLHSKYLIKTTRADMMLKEYLEHGAVGVIASTAGSTTAADNLNYYFYDHLINKDKKVGDAFYDAMLEYKNLHGPIRPIRVFNFFGDPSLTLKGIANRPGGTDITIHEASFCDFSADNSKNGDMYVAVLTTNAYLNEPGEIKIHRSTDHGQSWNAFSTISDSKGFYDVDVVVADAVDRLLVFYTDTGSRMRVHRFPLSGGSVDIVTIHEDPTLTYSFRELSTAGYPHSHYINLAVSRFDQVNQRVSVQVWQSLDCGITWYDGPVFNDFGEPSIDFSPYDDKIYLVARKVDPPYDIHFMRSTDSGTNWDKPTSLTTNDGGLEHEGPVVATTTSWHAGEPPVWVAYKYNYQASQWVTKNEIRYAYSSDAGKTWTTNRILSGFGTISTGGDAGARAVDMKGWKAGANPWINVVYNYNPGIKWQIIWRYAHDTIPSNWSAPRIVNDIESIVPNITPRIIYSPGAPGSGSGVVYATQTKGIYFSAPWLTGSVKTVTRAVRQEDPTTFALNAFSQDYTLDTLTVPSVTESVFASAEQVGEINEPPLIWLETGELEGAFAVSSLIQATDEVLYTGATMCVDETRNQGAIFRSTDGGDTWERLGDLDNCWSLACIFESNDQSLFAGGSMVDGERAYGKIYRSEDGGDTWDAVLSFPDGVVCDLMQTANGHLYAATGWNGLIFKSEDGGHRWFSLPELGDKVHVRSIIQASDEVLYAALEGPGNGRIIRSTDDGKSWMPAEGLEGVVAVYDLMESNRRLYAGVRVDNRGWIYQSELGDLTWRRTAELPDADIEAVRCLALGPGGEIFAGGQMMPDHSFTKVFVMPSEGEHWEEFGGMLDLATSVSTMLVTSDMVYVGTGYIYGNVYRCGL